MNMVVLATRNQHKVEEIRSILADLPLTLLTLADFPHLPEVVEDGATCQENAVKKAREFAKLVKFAAETALSYFTMGTFPF